MKTSKKFLLALLATSLLQQAIPAAVLADDAVLREGAQVTHSVDTARSSVEQIDFEKRS